jgi:hypothetical protein
MKLSSTSLPITAGLLVTLLGVTTCRAGCTWQTTIPPDVTTIDPDKPGLGTIREYVPAGALVTLNPTSMGTLIQNRGGGNPTYVCDNREGAAGFTSNFASLKQVTDVNLLPLTDIRQSTTFGDPTGMLQAAAFTADGSMQVLGTFLAGAGYFNDPLQVPDFASPNLSELFFGVSLDQLAMQSVGLSPSDIGAEYEVTSGVPTELLSGTGPTAAQLATSYFFGRSELTPAPGGGWTGSSYTGPVELFGWHELLAVAVPEPPSFGAFAAGLAALALSRLIRSWRA